MKTQHTLFFVDLQVVDSLFSHKRLNCDLTANDGWNSQHILIVRLRK